MARPLPRRLSLIVAIYKHIVCANTEVLTHLVVDTHRGLCAVDSGKVILEAQLHTRLHR